MTDNEPKQGLNDRLNAIEQQIAGSPDEGTDRLLSEATREAERRELTVEDFFGARLRLLRAFRHRWTDRNAESLAALDSLIESLRSAARFPDLLFTALAARGLPNPGFDGKIDALLDEAAGLLPKLRTASPLLLRSLDGLAMDASKESPDLARSAWEHRIRLAEAAGMSAAVVHGKVQLAMHYEYAEPDPQRAVDLWEDVVATWNRLGLDPHEPIHATHLQSLARARQAAGRPAAATEAIEQAKSIEGGFPDHRTLWSEALLLQEQSKFAEAASVYRRLLDWYRKSETTEYRDYTDAWAGLAQILEFELKDLPEARAEWEGLVNHYREMIRADTLSIPARHHVFDIFGGLVRVLGSAGDWAAARAVAEEAIALCDKYWGEDSPFKIGLWAQRAGALENLGDRAGAAADWENLAAFITAQGDPSSPDIDYCRERAARLRAT